MVGIVIRRDILLMEGRVMRVVMVWVVGVVEVGVEVGRWVVVGM